MDFVIKKAKKVLQSFCDSSGLWYVLVSVVSGSASQS